MPFLLLGVVGAVGLRVAPVVARATPLILSTTKLVENKINFLGGAVAGAIGWAINERNQDKADARHRETLAQNERQHQEMLAQQGKLNAGFLDAVRTGHNGLSAQMNDVARGVGEANSRLIGLDKGMGESHLVLGKVMAGVNKTNATILQCTRGNPTGQSLPTRELVLQ